MSKKMVILTTEHLIQLRDCSDRGEFYNIVLYLLATYSPQVIVEEWRWDGSRPIAQRIADERLGGAWHNISPTPDLKLTWGKCRNLDNFLLAEYGPVDLQTAREQQMIDKTQEVTKDAETILLIAGLAHHQSLSEKFTNLGFNVEGFCFFGPAQARPDCSFTDWRWLKLPKESADAKEGDPPSD
jgi:hypothetical protein